MCCGDALTFELGERFFAALGTRVLEIPGRDDNKDDGKEKTGNDTDNSDTEPRQIVVASGDDGSNQAIRNPKKKEEKPEVEPQAKHAKLVHIYGTTETTADATFEVFEDLSDLLSKSSRYKMPYGLPIANTMIYLRDDNGNAIGEEETGEICVSGTCLAMGYAARTEDHQFTRCVGVTKNPGKRNMERDIVVGKCTGLIVYHESHGCRIPKGLQDG